MKKFVLSFVIIAAVTLLSACGTKDNTLYVGMDCRYPPFETVDANNNPIGISADIANAFGAYIGRPVEIVNTEFSLLIPGLESGELDIVIASMSITEEREQSVDFSNPYFYFKIISLVNKDFADANSITEDSSVEDLLAVPDANYVGIVSQVSVSIPESYGKTVTSAIDVATAVEEVSQGTADILFMSANPVTSAYQAHPETTMVLWDAIESSPIGMAVQEGNSELLQQANDFIATFNDQGGMYDTLKTDWDAVIMEQLGRYGLDFYINE